MARILVCEPNDEIRALLALVIGRLGHEALFPEKDGSASGVVDVMVVEPGDPVALAAAQIARLEQEDVPVVCASIFPPSPHTNRLRPVAFLVKPFSLGDLEAAIRAAVARSA